MKQILQNLKTGKTQLVDVPVPKVSQGLILIRTEVSLVSLGTEKMLIEFGKANLINKARQQPDKVKQVIQKIKTDGLVQTTKTIQAKLDAPLPLGYCNAGVVVAVGSGVKYYQIGDRVVSNGHHAEFVVVPEKLCAIIPNQVKFDQAVFTVISSIALQGIRLAKPTIGESFVVIGLGVIGLLTVQILKANGCNVIGVDLDKRKLELAMSYGAEVIHAGDISDPAKLILAYTKGRGADGVLITVATISNDPIHNAAQMCRKRGRIILVGVTGLDLKRSDFYEKELSFQVSCSYGPGRYDSSYEQEGNDYPLGFVRWTEQRNFEAILELLDNRSLNVERLISHRYQINDIEKGYAEALGDKASLGIIIGYNNKQISEDERSIIVTPGRDSKPANDRAVVGVIGAGNFTSQFILPNLAKTSVELHSIASKSGVSSTHLGKKFKFRYSVTDPNEIIKNPNINTVFITTRHNTHALFVTEALLNNKNVFVEKPLAITNSEFDSIESVIQSAENPFLMIGYNRRFAPIIKKMIQLLKNEPGPKSVIMTVNAGFIPSDHWVQDNAIGGGRIIGEACHFIDLLRYIIGANIVNYSTNYLSEQHLMSDIVTINLKFQDGSIGCIHYFANGHKSFPKERLEIYCNGKILQCNNFKQLYGFGWPGFNKQRLLSQDKGHKNCINAFISAINLNNDPPIPINEILEIAKVTLEIAKIGRTSP
ncbi:MAG: zinc-binding dehydrogenase [Candidatus Marinimicrobia bacterium]|nr:zinc-binding dehydrogenase [Candidatus Neomarinimicrobiota bacterium]